MKRLPGYTVWSSVVMFTAMLPLFSCSGNGLKTQRAVAEYIKDKDHGLVQTEEMTNGVRAELTYQPGQLLAARFSPSQKKASPGFIRNIGKSYFFVLRLSKDGKELLRQLDFNTYSEMVQVLSFRMGAYVTLSTDRKADLAPSNYFFQQTYGMSDANSLLLSFDRKEAGDARELTVHIHEFGLGLGDLSFRFDRGDLDHLDAIDYKNLN